ncbi:MAG: flotillin family protein [Planctomycetes bacterium]|nr:flotillin family protein [Planctomycetota bacterium]
MPDKLIGKGARMLLLSGVEFAAASGAVLVLALVLPTVLLAKSYRRCPPNRMLVVYGQGVPNGSKCIRGGGVLVWPIIQDCAELSLEPIKVPIVVERISTHGNDAVEVNAVVTVAIGQGERMSANAAERLIGLDERAIETMVRDILVGNLRRTVAMRELAEVKGESEKLSAQATEDAAPEVGKVGLEILGYRIDRVVEKA